MGHLNQSEIDRKMNKYTLHCFQGMLICTLVIWIANLCGVFIVNKKLVSWGFSISVVIFLFALIFGHVVDLKKPWVKYVLLFCAVAALSVDGAALSYHAVLISVLPLIISAQYASKKVLIYTYVISVVGIFASVMGSYYFGLCDANMLLLTTESVSYYVNQTTGMFEMDIANTNPWLTLPLYYALPRCMLLTCFLPIIHSISKNIMEYAADAVNMKQLSERDEMTGLYNKNKYLEMMDKKYPKLSAVGVIFWDINNLKVINDTAGHDQGDYIITTVARLIREMTDHRKRAYRIGGDEFIMIIENPEKDELEQLLLRWEEILAQGKAYSTVEISVSVGAAEGSGKDIEAVRKRADEKMYEQKKLYHQKKRELSS